MIRARLSKIFFGVLTFFLVFFSGIQSSYATEHGEAHHPSATQKFNPTSHTPEGEIPKWMQYAQVVGEIFYLIDEYYLYRDDVDWEKCLSAVLYSLNGKTISEKDAQGEEKNFSCLDRYSLFISEVAKRSVDDDIRGSFEGVGIEITDEDGKVIVVTPIDDTPADRAGVQPGDIIISVRQDDETEFVPVKTSEDAANLLRGRAGTKVYMKIKRDGVEKNLTLTRAKIPLRTVEAKEYTRANGDKVGYVRVKRFSGQTAYAFRRALQKFQNNGTHPQVVVDLRNNPGGLLSTALAMLYYFEDDPNTRALSTRGVNQNVEYTISNIPSYSFLRNTPAGEFEQYHIVVLVNKGSASASEIFAGTMEDWGDKHARFQVVGSPSFGKGIGQRQFPLNSRQGALFKLTTFEFLVGDTRTPVHGVGVQIDHEVQDCRLLPEYPRLGDCQLEKAFEVLKGMK